MVTIQARTTDLKLYVEYGNFALCDQFFNQRIIKDSSNYARDDSFSSHDFQFLIENKFTTIFQRSNSNSFKKKYFLRYKFHSYINHVASF